MTSTMVIMKDGDKKIQFMHWDHLYHLDVDGNINCGGIISSNDPFK